jgi:excisionase family DNA binding protein|tara:strand:- start:169 stop:339 length:171 start_codon:yes stop_codon:yes gene_type:complete
MKLALSIKESSEAIGVGTTNLRKMCKDNVIPNYKEGKKIMIPVKALQDWINQKVGI